VPSSLGTDEPGSCEFERAAGRLRARSTQKIEDSTTTGLPMKIIHSARELLRSPVSTITIVTSLALGIGANVAVFSPIYAVVLRPLPYPHPNQLVAVYETSFDKRLRGVALANLIDFQDQSTRFDAMAGYLKRSFGLETGHGAAGQPVGVVQIGMVTSEFFRVLGANPSMGRPFSRQEEMDETPVIILTDRLWRDDLQGVDNAVGSTVRVNDAVYTVIGVLPADFTFQTEGVVLDAYIPISHKDYGWSRSVKSLSAMGRLKPSVTIAEARTELQSIAARSAQVYPENSGCGAELTTLHEALEGKNREPLLFLMAAAVLLLLIACANVASILLAKALAAAREVSVMISLGARTRHLASRFLVDGALLSVTGTVCGLLLARFVFGGLQLVLPSVGGSATSTANSSAGKSFGMDGAGFVAALGFAIAIALVTSLVFALLPLLVTRKLDLYQLMSGSTIRIGARRTAYKALVAGQTGLSAVLVLFSGLLIRSFYNLVNVDPGFTASRVVEFGIGLPEKRYSSEEKLIGFHKQLLERLAALPGVESVGAVGRLPISGRVMGASFEPEGSDIPKQQRPTAAINLVSPSYFQTMNIPLVRGREFSLGDTLTAPRVIMVNQAFVRAQLAGSESSGGGASGDKSDADEPHGDKPAGARGGGPAGDQRAGDPHPGDKAGGDKAEGEEPADVLGRRLRLSWKSDANPTDLLWQIVGVVGDTRETSFDQFPLPEIYLPVSQFGIEGCGYVLKTGRAPGELQGAIEQEVWSIDNRLERVRVRRLQTLLSGTLSGRKTLLLLTLVFAGIATALTAVGVYGIMSFSVIQKRLEFGIRAALGARSGQIMTLVIGQGLQIALAGMAVGLIAFQMIARLVKSAFYQVQATDLTTNFAVVVALICIAIAACAVPAWRASRTSPAEAIKQG
jgi:putative ABC transport system permease protein